MINGGSLNDAQVNGFYAADEAAYQMWLRDLSAPDDHIVELGYAASKDGSNVPTGAFIPLSDFPLAGYHERIKALPSFTRQIDENFSGTVSASIGQLDLDNTDGALDSWLTIALDGWPLRIKHGDRSWLPERFRIINTCISEIISAATEDTISVRLRSPDFGANLELQPNTLNSGPNIGAPIPLAYGKVFNVEPVVVDAANQVYQWHDGAVQAVTAVRDSGIDFGTASVSVTAFSGDSFICAASHGFVLNTRITHTTTGGTNVGAGEYWVIATGLTSDQYQVSTTRGGSVFTPTGLPVGMHARGYHWTATLSDGKVLLDSTPSGQLTMDGQGYNTGGYISDAPSIAQVVLQSINVDAVSKSSFLASATQDQGVYARERSNRLDIADALFRGISSWYGRNRMGFLQFGRVVLAPTYEYLDVTNDQLLEPIALDRLIMPQSYPQIGYAKNWTVQSTGLAAGVSDSNRALYSQPFSIKRGTPPPLSSILSHLLATSPTLIESMMTDATQANTEMGRLSNLWNGWGGVFNVVVGRVGYTFDIGRTVKLTTPRYGFSGGVLTQIVSIDDQPSAGTVALKVYLFLDTIWPGQL